MTERQMSGRETHAARIPFYPELVSLRVLLQSPSARHNIRCSPFRVGKLLEPRTQLQSFVLGLYYLARKDDGHVISGLDKMANNAIGQRGISRHIPSSPTVTTFPYPHHAMSIQTALNTEFPELSYLTCISC